MTYNINARSGHYDYLTFPNICLLRELKSSLESSSATPTLADSLALPQASSIFDITSLIEEVDGLKENVNGPKDDIDVIVVKLQDFIKEYCNNYAFIFRLLKKKVLTKGALRKRSSEILTLQVT